MADTGNGRKRAFVLMPFGPAWDPIYHQLVVPPLSDAGYEVARADTFLNQQNVLKDIVRGIEQAHLIIAEVTSPNPNVFYELGLAQGLGRPTILIAQELDQVPFDLRSYRIELYSTDFTRVDEFRERIRAIALEHLADRLEFGSPLVDFLSTGPEAKTQATAADEASGDEVEATDTDSGAPAGFLDHFMALEEASNEFEPTMNEIAAEMEILGHAAEEKGEKMQRLNELPSPSSPREAYKLTLAIANDMRSFASRLSKRLPDVERQVQAMTVAGAGIAGWITQGVSENPGAVREMRKSVDELLHVTRQTISEVEELRDAASSVLGAARELDRAAKDVAAALDKLLDNFRQVEAFAAKTVGLADEALLEADG